MNRRDPRALKFLILEILSRDGKAHRYNLLGRPYQAGALEDALGGSFSQDERALAGRTFEELQRDGLIEPTYADLATPGDWVQLSEAGKVALDRRALDDLDGALHEINLHLAEIRAGAWSAACSAQPDALRQAAHSGRELIDQTLKAIAPDDEVRKEPGFHAGPHKQLGRHPPASYQARHAETQRRRVGFRRPDSRQSL